MSQSVLTTSPIESLLLLFTFWVVGAKPKAVFDDSALTAAREFKDIPRYLDGKPTQFENVFLKILDEFEGEDVKSPERARDDKSSNTEPQHPMFRHPLQTRSHRANFGRNELLLVLT